MSKNSKGKLSEELKYYIEKTLKERDDTQTGKIMVVDDEEFNLDIIATFFRILDVDLTDDRVTYCRDGEQALNIIKASVEKG